MNPVLFALAWVLTNDPNQGGPMYWLAVAFSLTGLIKPASDLVQLVEKILKLSHHPQLQHAARVLADATRRIYRTVAANVTMPKSRRKRPMTEMALALWETILYCLYTIHFTALSLLVLLMLLERQGSMRIGTALAGMGLIAGFGLLAMYYAVAAVRTRNKLRARWSRLDSGKRHLAGWVLACVPATLIVMSFSITTLSHSTSI